MSKTERITFWVICVFALVIGVCGFLVVRSLSGVYRTYENYQVLALASVFVGGISALACICAALGMILLVVDDWQYIVQWAKRVWRFVVRMQAMAPVRLAKFVERMALKVAAKMAALTSADKPPAPEPPPPPKPKPNPPQQPPPPPPPPRPRPNPPKPKPPAPEPPPSDPSPVPSWPGPDDGPSSGGAALPVPVPPIRKMAELVA